MILPGTGRGTMRSMVEGSSPPWSSRRRPGTSLALRLLWVPAFAGMTGCGGATETERASTHPTIVSLNPCADAMLHEVAAPGQLLAVSHYSHDPGATSMVLADALQYKATGGTVEEVLALAPDIVVADTFLAPATREALEAAGVAIVSVGMVSSLEDSLGQIALLGETVGAPERAALLAGTVQSAWDNAASDAAPVATLLWQDGGIVAGEGSLAFALLEQSGFTSHSAARGLGQGAYLPLEQVLADPPQLILASGGERMLTHPVLGALDGVRYATFDSALLYCGGPTIPRALERLGEIRRSLPLHHPPAPSSEEEGETVALRESPLLFRGGDLGVVQ